MSIGVYMRVSKGVGRGQDVASQKPDLERWVAAQSEPAAIYVDHQTGKTMDRPGFARLMADVRGGKIKTIVVWRLDRLGRTARGLTALFDDLRALKVNLVSLRDGLDLSTPAGRLMANVLASVAAYETEVRVERVLAGLAVAKAEGRQLGRKPVGQGNGTRLKVSPEQQALARRLKSEGTPIASIARTLGLSRPTVYTLLNAMRLALPATRAGGDDRPEAELGVIPNQRW
jgi:DNA invertase Pin-like site-specific DNA recombinase